MKKWLISFSLLCLSSSAFALSTDKNQPVYIDSDSQQVDLKKAKVVFEGKVKLRQGSIVIDADKLIVYRNLKTGELKEIEAYGNLVQFSQKMDDGKMVNGESKELYYSTEKDELTMIDQAMLSQDGSKIRGKKIRYKITKQELIADSNKTGGRVSTVILPTNFKEQENREK